MIGYPFPIFFLSVFINPLTGCQFERTSLQFWYVWAQDYSNLYIHKPAILCMNESAQEYRLL